MDIKNTETIPPQNEIIVSGKTIAADKHDGVDQDEIRYRKRFQIGCDGVSGEEGGKEAAKETADTLEEVLSGFINLDPNEAQNWIIKTLYGIDKKLKAGSTTATVVYISERKDGRQTATIVNIGDSRAYLFRKNEENQESDEKKDGKTTNISNSLEELTLDDNIVKKEYPEDEARRLQRVFSNTIDGLDLSENDRDIYDDLFRYTNIVYQSVGKNHITSGVSVTTRDLKDGDRLLICTDGLTANLRNSEIEEILKETEDNSEAINKLFERAKKNNRYDDDISVILVDVKKK